MTVIEASHRFLCAPDDDCVCNDGHGRKMFLFTGSFEYDGSVFSVDFFAYDFEDAEKRVMAMKSNLTVDGQIYSRGDV